MARTESQSLKLTWFRNTPLLTFAKLPRECDTKKRLADVPQGLASLPIYVSKAGRIYRILTQLKL
jgi:hypothetical protein